jgi:PAS domain S-box-containing protein
MAGTLKNKNISQRQATIAVLGFQWAALMILWASQVFAQESDATLTLGAGIAALIYGAMLFAYLRGWEYARHVSVILITLIVAVFLPEPFITTYAPFLILLGPILALVLLSPLWVIGSAVATIGIMLFRAGGGGVYANPMTLINFAMLIVGLVVSRVIAESARTQADQARATQEELASIVVASEERFRQLWEATVEGIAIHDQGVFLEINPALSNMFGYLPREVIGKSMFEFIGAEASEIVRQKMKDGVTEPYEVPTYKADGTKLIVELIAKTIVYQGKTVRMVAVRDVTDRKQAEQALGESEERFRKTFRSVPVGLAITRSSDGAYIDANDAFSQITGYSLAELTGQTSLQLNITTPEQRREYTRQISEKGFIRNQEMSLRTKSGEYSIVLGSMEVIELNHETCVLSTAIDITQRKRMEDALRENEKQLKQTQAIAGLGNYFIDLTTGNWMGSEIFDHLLGIDETFKRTMETWPTLIHPTDREPTADYFANEVVGKGARFDREYRIIRPNDQAERWVHTLGELEFNSENQPIKMVGTVQDITESKLAKTQLEYQARLLSKINDAILAADDQYNITVWNHGAELLYGWSAAEAIGRKTTEIVRSEMTSAEREGILKQLHESGEYHIELTQYHKNGQPVYVEASTVSIKNDIGQITGILSVNRDISERKQAEEEIRQLNENLEKRIAERTAQLESANKELEAFSYSVSHDLRAPLRGIDGWSQALVEDYGNILDEQAQTYIKRVRSETQRMGTLIDDLLQLSRIARADLYKKKVNLSAIAEVVVARLQETGPAGRQVEFVIQKGLTAMGDPKLLEVLFTNLLDNAFKFTSKKPEAHIEFGQTVVEGAPAYFVRDNGAGFDMKYAIKLFGAFQRMHKTSEFPGSGVGLATVQRVIHRHGGEIWAASEVGQGTTFYFTLEEKRQ